MTTAQALCWIHAGRHDQQRLPVGPTHREQRAAWVMLANPPP